MATSLSPPPVEQPADQPPGGSALAFPHRHDRVLAREVARRRRAGPAPRVLVPFTASRIGTAAEGPVAREGRL